MVSTVEGETHQPQGRETEGSSPPWTGSTVGGYGSPHEKGIDGGEKLAQKRDRDEVTNSRSESKQGTVRSSI
jgi:hypothetical protein